MGEAERDEGARNGRGALAEQKEVRVTKGKALQTTKVWRKRVGGAQRRNRKVGKDDKTEEGTALRA